MRRVLDVAQRLIVSVEFVGPPTDAVRTKLDRCWEIAGANVTPDLRSRFTVAGMYLRPTANSLRGMFYRHAGIPCAVSDKFAPLHSATHGYERGHQGPQKKRTKLAYYRPKFVYNSMVYEFFHGRNGDLFRLFRGLSFLVSDNSLERCQPRKAALTIQERRFLAYMIHKLFDRVF